MSHALMLQKRLRSSMVNDATWLGPKRMESTVPETIMVTPTTILTLTGFIPKPFKYVSKAEILKIPFVGWPMKLANHIALRTGSRRSQLETFKDTIQSLKDGNSVVTFPEGTRSRNGRLMPFKGGVFSCAPP